MLEIFQIFLEPLQNVVSGKADWWIYAIILFIPFSVMIAIREGYCWFNKVNKVINRLERLDRRFHNLNNTLELLVQALEKPVSQNSKENTRFENNKFSSEEPFVVEKDWSEKKNSF